MKRSNVWNISRRFFVFSFLAFLLFYGKEKIFNVRKVIVKRSLNNKTQKYPKNGEEPFNDTIKAMIALNEDCPGVFYDVADKALHVWNTTETKCLEYEDNLFKAKLVKTKVFSNGTEENFGCRSDTLKCTERPYFDSLFNVRVNMPPCCRSKIISLYRHFNAKLEENNITHFLMYGALIGYHRNQHFVPYDLDIDFYVDVEIWNQKKLKDILESLKKEYGHNYSFEDGGVKLKLFYSNTNNNSLDAWPFSVVHDFTSRSYVHIHHFDAVDQPLASIFPLRKVFFEDAWTYIPRYPDRVLDLQYGQGNWEDELDCKYVSSSSGSCILGHAVRKSDREIPHLLLFLFTFLTSMTSLFCLIVRCSRPNRDIRVNA